ncbi:hypothetical protein IWX49DRAFT_558944 [Phyllosticta citricarpa]
MEKQVRRRKILKFWVSRKLDAVLFCWLAVNVPFLSFSGVAAAVYATELKQTGSRTRPASANLASVGQARGHSTQR